MNQEQEKKYFLAEDSQLDADSAPFAVSPNSWVNMQNFRVRTTDAGVTETVESIGGTIMLSTPQPSVTYVTIGSAEETERSRFCYFKACTTGPWDKIVCWDEILQQEFDVLLASQVTGGLNFDKNSLIHSARIVNGLLYWTDNLNEPKKINIDAGILTNDPTYVTTAEPYALPLTYEMTTVIKRPSPFPPTFVKAQNTGIAVNNVAREAFQFSYRYFFKDSEYSVQSMYSLTANLNLAGDNNNYIQITIPFNEVIQDDVLYVELLVKYLATSAVVIIKTWNKDLPADLTAIQNHNAGITALTYAFYNNTVGGSLDSAEAIKHNEVVPILSESLEVAKNRLFLANNLQGYSSPLLTSMTLATVNAPAAGEIISSWFQYERTVNAGEPSEYNDTVYYIYLTNIAVPGIYYLFSGANYPPFPSTIAFADLVFQDPDAYNPFFGATITVNTVIPNVGSSTVTGASPLTLNGYGIFKSNSLYIGGTVFYDRYRRWCGYVSTDDLKIVIPPRDYTDVEAVTNIRWTLNEVPLLNEIPEFAYYYAPLLSKSLTTSFFIQARTTELKYVIQAADGTFTYSNTYDASRYGIAVNVQLLSGYGIGYVFNDGDLAFLYLSGDTNTYSTRVLGQDGYYVIMQLLDLGDLTAALAVYELYTPIRASAEEVLWEQAQVYPILDPGTDVRRYSTLTGLFQPDIYVLERGTSPSQYLAEAMSPNDKYYKLWNTNAGFPSFFDNIGQQQLNNQVAYSNVIIDNTRTNGLSSFDALNVSDVPVECGAISKLQVTSKVNNEIGIVMLSICTKETASLYIGEVQLVGQNSNAFLAQAPNVIGTINVLKGSRGTTHPESVSEYLGSVFFWDDGNGKLVQYSANGLFDISNYKMTRFWKLFSDQFLSMTQSEIEALGSRPFVFTTVDPNHHELLITIPKLLNAPPKGYLPDYPFIQYPFDIWDGQAKTIVYKLGQGADRPIFLGSYSFTPEWYTTLQNKLYSFVSGMNFLHNQPDNPCEFYGVQYSSKIMPIGNAIPNKPKMYNNVKVESNLKPDFVYMYNDYPVEQASNLINDDFRDLEGVWFATVKRNNLRITENGYVADGLMTGEKMRNVAMWFMFEWRVNGTPVELKFVNIGFEVSRGITV